MKYKLALAVKDHRGVPLKLSDDETLTLGLVLERACVHGGEQGANADTKFAQYKLAQRIARGSDILSDPVEFSAQEVTALKKLCAQVYAALAYGAIEDMLENEQYVETAGLSADVAAVIGQTAKSERDALLESCGMNAGGTE